MAQLTLEQIHGVLLGILKQIDEFCTSHSLRYSIAGGTLLGALRHKGFIPWDDDADVVMPRPDYETFVKLFNKEAPKQFRLLTQSTEKDHYYVNVYSKLEDTTTNSVEYGLRGIAKFGLNVDIFPIDGTSDDPVQQRKQLKKVLHYKRRIVLCQRPFSRLLLPHGGPPLAMIQAHGRPLKYWVEQCDRTIREYDFESSNYAGALCGLYITKEIFPRPLFEEYERYPFEDTMLAGFKDAETYLTSLYGDWRTPPPIAERLGKHKLNVNSLED